MNFWVTVTIRNKFDTLQEISDTYITNDKYENFVITYMKAAAAEFINNQTKSQSYSSIGVTSSEKKTS